MIHVHIAGKSGYGDSGFDIDDTNSNEDGDLRSLAADADNGNGNGNDKPEFEENDNCDQSRSNERDSYHKNRENDLISFYEGLNNRTKFEAALNSSVPPTIYACHKPTRREEFTNFMSTILPEYRVSYDLTTKKDKYWVWDKDLAHVESSEYDVIISTYQIEECRSRFSWTWIIRKFKGQFILLSGESEEQPPFDLNVNPRYHGFGPVPESSKDFTVTYMQVEWWNTFQRPLPPATLISGELRPKGNETHFLAYGQSNCVPFREEAFGRLAALGPVHQTGKCKGRGITDRSNVTIVNPGISIYNWRNNQRHYANYRFCLVMEHADPKEHPQYVTEKIMMAFVAGCIPIYYGPDMIFDIFNEKAFVFYNISNPQPALDQIAELERDRVKYNAMKMEPIVAHGNETIDKYFSMSDDIGNGSFKRRAREKLHLPY